MRSSVSSPESTVAAHYDCLDGFYRDIWGEHLHHGLWKSGSESVEEAVQNLVMEVSSTARIAPGMRVGDIGSGYGATSRAIATRFDVAVDAYTVSARQHAYAVEHLTPDLRDRVRFHLQDWLEVREPPASFDALISIECISHVGDPERFFRNAYQVLRPGRRMALTVWLRSEHPAPWMEKWLLGPICVEGRLAALRPMSEYGQLAETVGFEVERASDLTVQVAPTWGIIIRRFLGRLLTQSRYRRALLRGAQMNREFARALLRIWLAYRVGAMGYGLFALRRPKA